MGKPKVSPIDIYLPFLLVLLLFLVSILLQTTPKHLKKPTKKKVSPMMDSWGGWFPFFWVYIRKFH